MAELVAELVAEAIGGGIGGGICWGCPMKMVMSGSVTFCLARCNPLSNKNAARV